MFLVVLEAGKIPKSNCKLIWFLVRDSLPSLKMVADSLYPPHVGEDGGKQGRERENTWFIRTLFPPFQGFHPYDLITSPKNPLPNIMTLGFRAAAYEFWGDI